MRRGWVYSGGEVMRDCEPHSPQLRLSFPPSIPSGSQWPPGDRPVGPRPGRRHGDKHHGNLPPVWGLEGREELRQPRPHAEAAEQGPSGPGWLLPSHEGPLSARACLGRGNATSTSVLDEWLALASQETVGSIQVQTLSHSHPPGQRGRKRELKRRRRGIAKQGRGRDSWDRALIVPNPHAAPRQARLLACPPGPRPRIPPGLSQLLSSTAQGKPSPAPAEKSPRGHLPKARGREG